MVQISLILNPDSGLELILSGLILGAAFIHEVRVRILSMASPGLSTGSFAIAYSCLAVKTSMEHRQALFVPVG